MNISDIDPQSLENAGQLATNVAKSYLGQKFLKLVASRFKRRDARLDAQKSIVDEKSKIISIAEAEASGELLKFATELQKGELLADYIKRSGNRLISEQIRKDFNLDSTLDIAAEQLAGEDPIQDTTQANDKTVSEDWFTRWTSIVEDISEAEVQQIWATILTGELKNPGTFSGRSFDAVRNLSRLEAEAFIKLCKYVVSSTDGKEKFAFVGDSESDHVDINRVISFSEFLLLEEAGLITPNSMSALNRFAVELFSDSTPNADNLNIYGDVIFNAVLTKETPSKLTSPVVVLTKAGRELHSVINTETDPHHLSQIKRLYESKTSDFTITAHNLVSNTSKGLVYERIGRLI